MAKYKPEMVTIDQWRAAMSEKPNGVELVKSMTIGHIYEVTYMQYRRGQSPTRNVVLGMCMGRGKSLILLTSNLHRRTIQSRNVIGVYAGEETA